MKKQKAKGSRIRNHRREAASTEAESAWKNTPTSTDPTAYTLGNAVEWVLDAVASTAQPYPEEAEAVARVHAWLRERQAGRPASIEPGDIVLVIAIVLAALDRDLTTDEHEMLGVFDTVIRRSAKVTPATAPRRTRASHASAQPITHYFRIGA